MSELPRLQQSQQLPQDWTPAPVEWSVRGETRPVVGDAPQTWLHLHAQATVWLTCQRCLNPVFAELSVERPIRFVRGEDQAETLDAESEDDVLALAPTLDLRTLIEDELILALPIVPRHDECAPAANPGMSVAASAATGAADDERIKAFGALAGFRPKRGGGSGGGGDGG